jgi:hypothetical protein
MGIEKRVNPYGVKLAAPPWGTGVVPGALDGAYFQTFDGFNLETVEEVDLAAGMGQEANSVQGNDSPIEPSFLVWPYESDRTAMLLLAMMMGSDDISGAGDPYAHKMTWEDISGKFCTVIGLEGTEVKSIPSALIQSLEIAQNANGIIQFSGQFKGNTVAVGGSVAAITYKADELPFLFRNMVLRINDQSAGALASGDAIEVSDFKIPHLRPSDSVIVTGGTTIVQPAEGEFPSMMLEFTIPHKTAVSNQLYTDWRAKTLKKVDITFSGSGATRELLGNFPQAKIEFVNNPHDPVISTIIRMRFQKASAAPTGMTAITSEWVWQNDEAVSMLP